MGLDRRLIYRYGWLGFTCFIKVAYGTKSVCGGGGGATKLTQPSAYFHFPTHTTPHQVREGLKTKGAQMVGCIIHTFTALGPTLLRTKSGAHHSFIQ